jgi:hypothetical protein
MTAIGRLDSNRGERRSIVAAGTIRCAEPNVPRFVFHDRPDIVVAQPILHREVRKGCSVVSIHPLSRGAEPHVTIPVLQSPMNIGARACALGLYKLWLSASDLSWFVLADMRHLGLDLSVA